jgi:pimeloyl-ACP methyl ester carboxylesterase
VGSTRLIATPDGRQLEVELRGPESGAVVLFHHGTPAAGNVPDDRVHAGAERGLRHVAYSRPGYAGSDRLAGRTVADCATDVATIADALGIERFYTLGHSGGGPHALACAALLEDRVIAAATIASIAPRVDDGLDWLDGMGEVNLEEFAAVDAGADELLAFLENTRSEFAVATSEQLSAAFGDLLSDVDRDAFSGDFAEFLAANTKSALRPGVWGWFDDDVACLGDWAFDRGAISRPVTIWQGRHDRFVPFAHGEWLANHVNGARAELREDGGHLSLATTSYGEVLDGLLATGGMTVQA